MDRVERRSLAEAHEARARARRPGAPIWIAMSARKTISQSRIWETSPREAPS